MKASCLALDSSLTEDLTHSAASHCNWCTTGTVPCQEGYVTHSWVCRCSRSLWALSAWLNSTSLTSLDFHLSKYGSSSSPIFSLLVFLVLGVRLLFWVLHIFLVYVWDTFISFNLLFWVLHVFLVYVWGIFISFNFFSVPSLFWESKKSRVGEVPATFHRFINFYLLLCQNLKVPVQITPNIHSVGLFICTSCPVSSLSNVISHGTFESIGTRYPNAFIFWVCASCCP